MKMNTMWNNGKYMIGIISMMLILSGCQQETMETETPTKGSIYLAVAIDEPISTKVAYEQTTPTQDNPLFATIWASSVSREYPNKGKNGADGEVALHTSVRFESGNPQLLDAVIYPKKDLVNNLYPPVYFIGLYPKSENWEIENNSQTAQFTFTGKEDVMFAPEISGHYGIIYENSPEFVFKHLLTLLKIKMIAESEKERDAWGAIKNMYISSPGNKVAIDLSKQYDSECLVYSGNADFPLYRKGEDTIFVSATHPYNLEYKISETDRPIEVAYVLCSPVEATDQGVDPVAEYHITIETDRRKVTIPVDLKKSNETWFIGNTRGHCFTLNLTFKMGNNIVVQAEIDDWEFKGYGNHDLTE